MTRLAPLPAQPAGTPWPTSAWPTGKLGPGVDAARLASALEGAFSDQPASELGETQALLIVQGGQLVVERYGVGRGADETCRSWSMAKSITQALAGILVGDGALDIRAPADAPEWRSAGDPRGAITVDHLLRMSSGLRFVEVYSPDQPSDVIEMLFGAGRDDMAGFAAGFPLEHPPGRHFSYSSGTTNIICRRLAQSLGASGEAFHAFMRERLFAEIGMSSADPRFDAAGTFIGSSYCYATPRDFARFGLLYLRGGVWDGARILPEGWVDYARTPTVQLPECADGPYGAHWWLDVAGPGSFAASGYQGQHVVLCPDRDLILVRHGATPEVAQPALVAWLSRIASLFPRVEPA